jgi:hypothetical protein
MGIQLKEGDTVEAVVTIRTRNEVHAHVGQRGIVVAVGTTEAYVEFPHPYRDTHTGVWKLVVQKVLVDEAEVVRVAV